MRYPIQEIQGYAVGKKNHYSAATDGNGKAYIYKDPILRAYEASFCSQCTLYKDKRINAPFTLYLAWYTDSVRQDIDNVLTSVLDCLQYVGAITDDNLCMKIVAERRPAKGHPKVVFSLETQFDEPSLFT